MIIRHSHFANISTGSRPRRGALQVYESLRDDILWLRIEPGSAIDECSLAKRFHVSRTPIREALLLLSGESFVKFLPNRTTIVAPFTMDNLGAYLDTLLILSRAVARSAALSGRANPSKMNSYLLDYEKTITSSDYEMALKTDHAFQRYLASLSQNMFQDRCFDQILDAGVRSHVLHYFPNATNNELLGALEMMHELASSILNSDPDESDQCISDKIRSEIKIVMRSLEPTIGYEMKIENEL